MKRLLLLALAGCLDQAADTSTVDQDLNGDSWQTVDDDGYGAGTGAMANGIAISPSTNKVIVVGGRGETDNSSTWTVKTSTGGVFSAAATYKLVRGKSSLAYNATADSAGYFYIVGTAVDASNIMHWIVRRSVDNAVTWTTVFDEGGHDVKDVPTGISADAAGNVFVSGTKWAFGKSTARVLRGPNHGASGTWTEVFTHAGSGADNNFSAVCTSKYGTQNATYAVGWESPSSTDPWMESMIYYTLDGGTTWLWKYDVGGLYTTTHAYGCTAGSNNRTMIVHGSYQTPNHSQWIADVTDFATNTDFTYDSYTPGSTTTTIAYGGVRVMQPAARYYVVGAAATGSATHWHVRYGADASLAGFVDSDDYVYPGGSTGRAVNAAYSLSQGLYAVGWALDGALRRHAIVRHRHAL